MTLKMFEFIDEVINNLENREIELENIAINIKEVFRDIIGEDRDGFLDVKARVKSSESLKEKILRNSYYKKFDNPNDLLSHLPDLIGVRVECRFNEDEDKVYKIIKRQFREKSEDGLHYNKNFPHIILDLRGRQPQKQKNGFVIYRIDGFFISNDEKIPFELQIKSLVNLFWSEIEHKIVYKNYNYLVVDKFLKDIMASIKKNLSLMDNELLLIYNHINNKSKDNLWKQKEEVEVIISKIIYDVFADKVENSLGFAVDFRKSCDQVAKYILRSAVKDNMKDYNVILINLLERLNEIRENEVEFNSEITFERELSFGDNFSRRVAQIIVSNMNNDFQWNLFFRIMFEIELGNNAEDFEKFIGFLKLELLDWKGSKKIDEILGEKLALQVKEEIMIKIANVFEIVESIEFIHNNNINAIVDKIQDYIEVMCNEFLEMPVEQWKLKKDKILNKFELTLLSYFCVAIPIEKANDIIDKIGENDEKISMAKNLINYYGKEVIDSKELVKIINK
ncbi:(p)ppGpp synthetase [uncultured Clostridium sp.]|uniref:GTP pyrophosphokinase n=1 Tax=uncultured Clostridium sp. TaxID=59620 RepID=UPI0025F6AC81|nr:(p)ppGpp synthetase [uncultured Clostridium sp.]